MNNNEANRPVFVLRQETGVPGKIPGRNTMHTPSRKTLRCYQDKTGGVSTSVAQTVCPPLSLHHKSLTCADFLVFMLNNTCIFPTLLCPDLIQVGQKIRFLFSYEKVKTIYLVPSTVYTQHFTQSPRLTEAYRRSYIRYRSFLLSSQCQ